MPFQITPVPPLEYGIQPQLETILVSVRMSDFVIKTTELGVRSALPSTMRCMLMVEIGTAAFKYITRILSDGDRFLIALFRPEAFEVAPKVFVAHCLLSIYHVLSLKSQCDHKIGNRREGCSLTIPSEWMHTNMNEHDVLFHSLMLPSAYNKLEPSRSHLQLLINSYGVSTNLCITPLGGDSLASRVHQVTSIIFKLSKFLYFFARNQVVTFKFQN
jgi:hypothetical protein